MFSVRDIQEMNKKKVDVKKETFKVLLTKFSHKIKSTYLSGGHDTILRIPPMVLGYPMYNVSQATWYLKRQLDLLGYRTIVPFDGAIYVSWASTAVSKAPERSVRLLGPPADEDLSSLTRLRSTAKKIKTRK